MESPRSQEPNQASCGPWRRPQRFCAGLRAEIEVPVITGRIVLPSLGAALVPDRSTVVRSGPGGAAIGRVEISQDPSHDAPGWLALRRVQAGPLDVLIDDLDPFRMPDAQNATPRSTGEPWDAALRGAWRVLENGHADVAAEIATLVSAIVPLSRPQSGEVSTTSPEAFGAVALSFPPDDVTCAVTLAHELQHLKLGALLDVVTLTLPEDGRRYYAPWRDDPRPLRGLLQGTYAYLGVTGFWRRQRRLPGNQLPGGSRIRAMARGDRPRRRSTPVQRPADSRRLGVRRRDGAHARRLARRARVGPGCDRCPPGGGGAPGPMAVAARTRLGRVTSQLGGGSKSGSSRRPAAAATASGWVRPRVAS